MISQELKMLDHSTYVAILGTKLTDPKEIMWSRSLSFRDHFKISIIWRTKLLHTYNFGTKSVKQSNTTISGVDDSSCQYWMKKKDALSYSF